MLRAPDEKGPHSCEEYGPVCCRSVLGALRRHPNSGPGMPLGIRYRHESSSPSILGLDSPWCLLGHLASSFLCRVFGSAARADFPCRVLSYTIMSLHLGELQGRTTTCSGYCDVVDIQLGTSCVPDTACRGGVE